MVTDEFFFVGDWSRDNILGLDRAWEAQVGLKILL